MTTGDLAAWHDVHDLSLRYAEGIDRRDWAGFASCFAPRVTYDFASFLNRPPDPRDVSLDEWVKAVRATIDGFPTTQHLIGNHRISFDSAVSGSYTAYVHAQHWLNRERWYLIGGWYENRVVRLDGSWRIAAVTLHQTWDAGERRLLREVNGPQP